MFQQKRIFVLIMAAGKGTRMGAVDKPKVLFEVAEKPIIGWGIAPFRELQGAGIIDRIITIVGFQGQQVIDYLGDQTEFVWQHEQLGTAHAVQMAESLLGKEDGLTIIVNGDHALSSKKTLQNILNSYLEKNLDLVFGVVKSADLFPGYGRVVRDDGGRVVGIVEVPEANDRQKQIVEKNVNLYVANNRWLFSVLPKIRQSSVKKEYYLVDIVKAAVDQGLKVDTFEMTDLEEALGINTQEERKEVEKILLKRGSK